jgi:hypothetical protein
LGLLGIDRAVAVGVHSRDKARRVESPATESPAETAAAETAAAETSAAAIPAAIPATISAAIGSSTHDHHWGSAAAEGHSWGLGQDVVIQRHASQEGKSHGSDKGLISKTHCSGPKGNEGDVEESGVGYWGRSAGCFESIDQKELEYPKPRIVFKVFLFGTEIRFSRINSTRGDTSWFLGDGLPPRDAPESNR